MTKVKVTKTMRVINSHITNCKHDVSKLLEESRSMSKNGRKEVDKAIQDLEALQAQLKTIMWVDDCLMVEKKIA